ncbi:McrC family protein [Vibrio parahaemolyticus]|uniref:McrC family protein n=1 Tax=Vibrio parahaemolyticus TaxID=670 RepID=UPI001EEC1D9B|nr:McrC family protein [Vibrio parahaemolyticus]
MAYPLTMPMRIKLQEYGEPVILQTENIDLYILAEVNNHWRRTLGLSNDPIQVEDIGNGFLKLRAKGITGVVRIAKIDIEITPKFLNAVDGSWQIVLWRILTVVEGGYIDDNLTTASQLKAMSMPDLLAEIFLSSYSKGAGRGLPRCYLTEEGAGNILRGKLDITRLSEWVTNPWILPYIADTLSDNTTIARLLRWSAETLATTVRAPGRSRALREIAASLTHVGKCPPHQSEVERICLGPQHQGLEAAKLIGQLLLQGAGVHHANGEHKLSGFLWNSDTIYENYVYWLCRRAAVSRGKRISKIEIKFGHIIKGNGDRLKTTPDVVFYDECGVAIAVTDAKYKQLGLRPKAADTYQVLTAGHVLGCERVSLTYPVSIDREPTIWLVPSALGGKDIELTVLPINLMQLALPRGQDVLIDIIGGWLDR